ncbi:MAG: hypothetical protein ACM359_14485 [Bacillota bacterium]
MWRRLIGLWPLLFASFVACKSAPNRQAEVAERGAQVMPFSLEKTTHIFQSLDDGGFQKVIVKDPADKEQIALIQRHLREEAGKFSHGDFSDPARIHGREMPGLAEMEANASKIDIRYSPLPDGGQIRYTTKDPSLVAVIHRWFAAQRHDHGPHVHHP